MDATINAELSELLGQGQRPIMVLLVDDQIVVGEAVRRALIDQPDIEFHFCADPVDAVALARKMRPTVILQDLVMPTVNGLDLVRQYRADHETASIPVIVLSTKEEATVKRDAFRIGANDYLVKLPDTIELIARIRYHSNAYLTQIQRDEAYRALRKSQRELMDTNLQLQRLTNIDGLTGLSSRRYFNEYISTQWQTALRGQYPVSMLMIDIDHFKQYNDHYGHLAGDEVLRKVSDALRKTCKRATDVVARFGGEEFVIALPFTGQEELTKLAESFPAIIEALHLPHAASPVSPWVTISVGGASAIPQRQKFSTLIEAADKALYGAKRGGRNRAVIHS